MAEQGKASLIRFSKENQCSPSSDVADKCTGQEHAAQKKRPTTDDNDGPNPSPNNGRGE